MKTYGGRGRTAEEQTFNYCLSRALHCVENVIGILANRFQVLLRTMSHPPLMVELIVRMILHNLMHIHHLFTHYKMQNYLIQCHGANCAHASLWHAERNLEDTIRAVGANCASRDWKMQCTLIRIGVTLMLALCHACNLYNVIFYYL